VFGTLICCKLHYAKLQGSTYISCASLWQSKDGTCDAMMRAFSFKKGMEQKEANQYRYIFDMGKVN
jgi:hypothetical protein